ncbi:YciI family protein [Pseudonocardia lacus]|uniref:YciI family protein n=1 Tax=Pseudonocardia lacus TaxID=2835865 RepID=UPI0027E2DE10|nr:YciI family protein [Pseudonocardia lacus]
MRRRAAPREEDADVKYMIMLYGSQQDYDVMAGRPSEKPAMSPEDVAKMHEYMGEFHQKLAESGELVDAQGLTAPVHARRVRLKGGVPVVTDGPYAETQEVLVGYTVVDVVGVDRAIEIASGLVNPAADGEYVDVRPIVDGIEELSL